MSYGKKSTVVVTTGLYELLDKEELYFVMTHEFSHFHLGHHQKRLLFAVIVLILFFVITYISVTKFIKKDDGRENFYYF